MIPTKPRTHPIIVNATAESICTPYPVRLKKFCLVKKSLNASDLFLIKETSEIHFKIYMNKYILNQKLCVF